MIELLTSEKTHGRVKKIVLEIIDRLLTYDGTHNDAMDVDAPALDISLPSLPAEYEGNEIYKSLGICFLTSHYYDLLII